MAGTDADDGERSQFAALYPALRRFANAVRPPGVDADDLVQEALARTLAVRSLASIDAPGPYLRAAIVRVAANTARGSRRRDARYRLAGAAGSDAITDRYPSDLDDLMRVAPRARAVLFLTVVEECSYAEAAAIVGCSEAAARQLASRGLRALRQQVSAELANGEPA